MDLISIIIPIYNEEKAVRETIEMIKQITSKTRWQFEIIAVNDGSTDKSLEVLKEISGIKIINNPYNLGYGASIKKGITAAKGEWILITDADGTYPIEDIPKLLEYISSYDMVVGARTGEKVHIPLLRKPAKRFITVLVNFMTGKNAVDVNSGLRIFKKSIATKFLHLFPPGFSFTTTLTLVAFTNDYTVKYVPINYYKRKGKSTISPFRDFIGFNALIFRIILYFRPLKFFLLPGLLLIIFGLITGTYQVMSTLVGLGQLPIILVLGGLQICFLGVLAELINKKNM